MTQPQTQYIECQFPSSSRRYSYANNNAPVRIGDFVLVDTNTGVQTVEVVGILDAAPQLPAHITLKSILGLSEDFPD